MARTRYQIRSVGKPHFMTCTVVNWLTLFNDTDITQIILDSWEFLQKQGRMRLYGYVILENHLHFVADAPNLIKEVGNFKSFTARQIISTLKQKKRKYILEQLYWSKVPHKQDRKYQVWQEGTHAELILNEMMLNQKLQYMHYNPVRRGYVDEPWHWRYFSARNFAGMAGLLFLNGVER